MSLQKPTYLGLPLYEAVIGTEKDGIYCVSFVSAPATETSWQLFAAANRRPLLFDGDKMEVTGVLMLADTPIYRVDEETGSGYYLYYSETTLRQMVSKLLKDNAFNTIDTQHDGNELPEGSCEMTEIYAKGQGKCPPEFAGIPDGSLICSYKIHDVELWSRMKSGELTGYSLAGWFTLVDANSSEIFNIIGAPRRNFKNNIMKQKKTEASKTGRKNSIKALLSRLILNFEETVLADGTVWLHDGELTEGTSVTLEDGTPVPDGSYETDTLVLTVTEGVVSSVTQKETGAARKAAPVEAEDDTARGADDVTPRETADYSVNYSAEIDALKDEINALKAEIEAIKSLLAAREDTPVVEEFNKAVEKPLVKDKISKTARFIAAL